MCHNHLIIHLILMREITMKLNLLVAVSGFRLHIESARDGGCAEDQCD